ncbi:MAG TPA: hypothetical protein VH877_34220 [Polyangia bacterium]|nr:hypothetical protein [Polyangia bacterium]
MAPERRTLAHPLALCVGGFILLRVLFFPMAQNYQADSLARASLAEHWAERPHIIRDPNEIYVYGPIHIYTLGASTWLLGRDLGPRLPSLVLGCLLVVPLIRLARRTGTRHGSAFAVAATALHSIHIQSSTIAASEAVFLTPLLFAADRALAMCEEGRLRDAVLCGLCLLFAEGVRYDGWMYAGLIMLVVFWAAWRPWSPGGARLGAAPLIVLGVLGSVFPLYWMMACVRYRHDLLWVFHAYGAYHQAFAGEVVARAGANQFRIQTLLFWPNSLLYTLSPGVLVLGVLGVIRASGMTWARRLLLVVIVPPILLTLRAIVLLDFRLIPRFSIIQAIGLTLFIGPGWEALRAWGARAVHGVLLWVPAVLVPAYILLWSHGRSGPYPEQLRSISPLADLPPAVAGAIDWIHEHRPDRIVVDQNGFAGTAVAAYSGLPEDRVYWVVSWSDHWEKQVRTVPPVCAVLFDRGVLGRRVALGSERIEIVGRPYLRKAQYPAPRYGISATIYCQEGL